MNNKDIFKNTNIGNNSHNHGHCSNHYNSPNHCLHIKGEGYDYHTSCTTCMNNLIEQSKQANSSPILQPPLIGDELAKKDRTMKAEDIKKFLASLNEDAVLYDDYDDALIGIAHRHGSGAIAAYDIAEVFKVIEKNLGPSCTEKDAVDHFEYKVMGTWAGEHTPIFIEVMKSKEKDMYYD